MLNFGHVHFQLFAPVKAHVHKKTLALSGHGIVVSENALKKNAYDQNEQIIPSVFGLRHWQLPCVDRLTLIQFMIFVMITGARSRVLLPCQAYCL